jgi:polar amino acid transport system substrate-binding protein
VTARRRIFLAAAATLVMLLAAVAAGCGSTKKASTGTGGTTSASSCKKSDLQLVDAGVLTIGTDNPAFPPWFGGTPHKPWQAVDPRSGEGYESAVAYAVARKLGFAKSEVKWIHVPFNNSFAPGPKSFDFDINQISFDKKRAEVVDFSDSYYDVNQSIVVNKGTPIASARSIADLKPSKQPSVFPQNAGAGQALKNKQIDGLVVDLPTAFYVTAVQVPNGKVLGQFPTKPGGEHFGMVFEKGNEPQGAANPAVPGAHHRGRQALGLVPMAELAVLQVVGSEPEAEIILSLLRSEGIPAIAQKTNYAVGLADAASSGAGPREILVHAENLERARAVLEDQPSV